VREEHAKGEDPQVVTKRHQFQSGGGGGGGDNPRGKGKGPLRGEQKFQKVSEGWWSPVSQVAANQETGRQKRLREGKGKGEKSEEEKKGTIAGRGGKEPRRGQVASHSPSEKSLRKFPGKVVPQVVGKRKSRLQASG